VWIKGFKPYWTVRTEVTIAQWADRRMRRWAIGLEVQQRLQHEEAAKSFRGGAGGNWRTIDEVADPHVVRQSDAMNCGAACGAMLLQAQGVFASQDVIANIAGAPSSAETLAAALDDLDSGGTWFGGGVTEASFAGLNETGLWAAMLFETGAKLGHWVSVSGLDRAGRVRILDPADGTRYVMEIEEFMSHWTLFSVFRRSR
jgi:filamentous hemagglutinin